MTPVMQTQFVAEHGKGNCVQACVASLLNLPLDEVTAFRDLPVCDFDDAIDKFLRSRRYFRIIAQFTVAFEWGDAHFVHALWHPVGDCRVAGPPAMLFGKSPRGNCNHAVVGRVWGAKFEVIHDPHPDGTGIVGNPHSIHWLIPIPEDHK